MLSNRFVFCFAVFSALMAVFSHRSHLLMCLLGLEGAVLRIVIVAAMSYGGAYTLNAFICVVILTFGACEASLGLALIVFITRSYGRDLVKSMNIVKCLKLLCL